MSQQSFFIYYHGNSQQILSSWFPLGSGSKILSIASASGKGLGTNLHEKVHSGRIFISKIRLEFKVTLVGIQVFSSTAQVQARASMHAVASDKYFCYHKEIERLIPRHVMLLIASCFPVKARQARHMTSCVWDFAGYAHPIPALKPHRIRTKCGSCYLLVLSREYGNMLYRVYTWTILPYSLLRTSK